MSSSSSSSLVPPTTMIDGFSEKPITAENEIAGSQIDVTAASESSDNLSKRDVWNKPVNSAAAAAAAVVETGIVIGGADLWPSLSEGVNTRVKPSYRTVPEGSGSLTSHMSSSNDSVTRSGWRSNSTHSGTRSGSHRPPKNNAVRSVGNGERPHQQQHRQVSHGPVTDVSSKNGSHNGNSQFEAGQSNGPRPYLHSGGNHSQNRDSIRRGNGGPARGDASHGRRRNIDRDTNTHPPNYNGRNGPGQPPLFPGPFPIPIPQTSLPIAPYPPPPPALFHPVPFVAPGIHLFAGRPFFYGPPVGHIAMRPHPLSIPAGPPFITSQLLKQIDYYFSDENLVKDVHLRRNMDEQGWVMVTTIAVFKKVTEIISGVEQFLKDNEMDHLQFISNVMQNSHNVEVQGDKLRKRTGWEKYILRNISESSSMAAESEANGELAVRLGNTVIEEPANSDSTPVAEDRDTNDQAGKQPS